MKLNLGIYLNRKIKNWTKIMGRKKKKDLNIVVATISTKEKEPKDVELEGVMDYTEDDVSDELSLMDGYREFSRDRENS